MTDLFTYLKEETEKWPGVRVYFRKDWDCWYFDIVGNYFTLYGEEAATNPEMVIFKGTPEKNELLREQYTSIVPGYHVNKTHWNSLLVKESNFTKEQCLQLVKESYDLVIAKLPKKVQKEIFS